MRIQVSTPPQSLTDDITDNIGPGAAEASGHGEPDGLVFDVLTEGPADAPAVLLLHGFPQTARSWDAVAAHLAAAGLRTLALDQRGYSPGARPTDVADYRLDRLVGDAVAILDALGVDTAHVVGHDWGSVVGWALAAAHPARVRTLTAVSVPHPAAYAWALLNDTDQQQRSAYIRLFQIPGKAEEVLLGEDARRLRAVYAPLAPETAEVHLRAMREPGALTAALAWYRAMAGAPGLGMQAPTVTVPTTFVWSTDDIAVGRAAAQRCGDHVTGPYRMVELAGISHWIPEQAPDALAEAVLARITEATDQPTPA